MSAGRPTPPIACSGITGWVATGFERLWALVEERCVAGGAVAVAAFRDGRPVVDLVTAGADTAALFHTWSVIKPVTGTCLLLLAERGRVGLDTPVRRIWPELRAAHSGTMLVRHVLGHSAGLVSLGGVGAPARLADWERSVEGLAANELDWPSGTEVGEHAFTFGHLVGELVRRIDGRSLGRFLSEELAEPLGLDLGVGVSAEDESRVVDTAGLDGAFWTSHGGAPGSLRRRALGGGVTDEVVNGTVWRRAEVPSVNGYATARALACFYTRLLEGRLPATVGERASAGMDRVLGRPVVWTLAGGQMGSDWVGMGGLGGQYAGVIPGKGLAWAFLTSGMRPPGLAEELKLALSSCAA